MKFYRMYCVEKATERKKEEAHLRGQLAKAIAKLQMDPSNEQWQIETVQCADYLLILEKKKTKGQQLRSRIKWKKTRDKCSREFFQSNKERSTAAHITELADSAGQCHTSHAAMSQICQDFYGKLYKARDDTPAAAEAKAKALDHISNCLPPAMKEKLRALVSLSELQKVLSEMKPDKSPGPDGIILEFFREYWALIGKEYLNISIHQHPSWPLPSRSNY
jgi:hypothetical protein